MSTNSSNNFAPADADLKRMLGDVLSHLTDSDRRNSAQLRQMQERLESLGHEARLARPGVPSAYLPGFERIEDGMSLLAARIAESYQGRTAAASAPQHAAPFAAAAAAVQPDPAPAYVPAAPVAPTAEAYIPPASPAAAFEAPAQPHALANASIGVLRARSKAYGPEVDTFDVIETMPEPGTVDTWTQGDASALVDIYTGAEGVVPKAPFTLEEANADAGTATKFAEPDRLWLDQRLSDIATRVERSLTEQRSDKVISTLEERLESFEQRMASVLKGVATKQDLESLNGLEDQIRDLRKDFELAHSELMRIDALERQLELVAHQTSEDNIGNVVSRFASTQPQAGQGPARDLEVHSVAIAAAEAAAARVINANRSGRVDDVHSLLSDFIQERRIGEEQTANTLDTLQQAMLRILDRVDAIEASPIAHNHPEPAAPEIIEPAAAFGRGEPDPLHRQEPLHLEPHAYAEPVEEAAPAPIPATDYLAQQRAKMQASVQRAAAAQREKHKGEGNPEAKTVARPSKPAQGNSRRLVVSSLALAVVAGGLSAWAVMSGGSLNLTSASTSAPVQTAQANIAKGISAGQIEQAINSATSDASAPQTVTGDLNDVVVAETDRAPEPASGRGIAARNGQSIQTSPAPLSGILLQSSETGSPAKASAAAPTAKATPISANMADIEATAPASTATTQANGALDLPPATVGPLSLRMAAAQGDSSAEFEVASRLAEGKGTDQNLKEAARWYQRAATKGFAQAQYRLGTLYERGLGMTADPSRARVWYQRAAEQGNVKAMHNLAVLAAGRSAESPDYTTAARWFNQAANYGLPDSQFNLAVLTESGLGVTKDLVQAQMWFTLAARSGDKEAVRRRDLLKSKMDAQSLAAADRAAKSWQPQVPDKMANDARAAGEAWKTRQASAQ